MDVSAIPMPGQSIMSTLLSRMHPCSCLQGSCGQVSDDTYYRIDSSINQDLKYNVPELLRNIQAPSLKIRVTALKKLYELTGKRQHLRVPIVCTTEWNVVDLLTKCLFSQNPHDSGNDTVQNNARRIACLTLNNLSIPYENKAVMMFGPGSTTLIESLVQIMRLKLPETYLVCICLMNLSFLDDAIEPILNYSPFTVEMGANSKHVYPLQQDGFELNKLNTRSARLLRTRRSAIESFSTPHPSTSSNKQTSIRPSIHSRSQPVDSSSLLRALESMMQVYMPFLMSKVVSVEREAIRWAMGLLRNLTKTDENCASIAKTNIPCLISFVIRDSPYPIVRWTEDSLEDWALLVLSRLATNYDGKEVLNKCDATETVFRIIGTGGIHETRANSIILSLAGG